MITVVLLLELMFSRYFAFCQPYNPFVLDSIRFHTNMENSPRFTPSPENNLESQIESELLHGIDPSVPTTNFIDYIRNK